MTESQFDFDVKVTRKQLERILNVSTSQFQKLESEGAIIFTGEEQQITTGPKSKMYWAFESIYNRDQRAGRQGKSSAASQERKDVQNALDEARREKIEHELKVARGEMAPTELMREIISRAFTQQRNKISGIKPILRSKYQELIQPQILDEIDQILSSSCEDIASMDLDDLINLSSLIYEEE